MAHSLRLTYADPAETWRTRTMVLAGVASVQLVLVLVLGGALLVKPADSADITRTRPLFEVVPGAVKPVVAARPIATKRRPSTSTSGAELPRRKVSVLVLNGNGRRGAAALAANRVTGRGYRVGGVANAPSHAYARSIVLYRPGFKDEGRRLARDLGVGIVSPLDGMRPGQLHGAHAVLILGG